MILAITIVSVVVMVTLIIVSINVQSSAPHVDDEHDDFILNEYLPHDIDLDGDITDVD